MFKIPTQLTHPDSTILWWPPWSCRRCRGVGLQCVDVSQSVTLCNAAGEEWLSPSEWGPTVLWKMEPWTISTSNPATACARTRRVYKRKAKNCRYPLITAYWSSYFTTVCSTRMKTLREIQEKIQLLLCKESLRLLIE